MLLNWKTKEGTKSSWCKCDKLTFSFIVCGVLIAFFLEGNLAIWNENPKKISIPFIGFYSKGREE